MFTKEEASKIKGEFWKTFGQYMAYVPSASGLPRINWINYKIGVKGLVFKMDANAKYAHVTFEVNHSDQLAREILIERVLQLLPVIKEIISPNWEILIDSFDALYNIQPQDNYILMKQELKPSNIFIKDEWGGIISFLKEAMVDLDNMWSEISFAFEDYKNL